MSYKPVFDSLGPRHRAAWDGWQENFQEKPDTD